MSEDDINRKFDLVADHLVTLAVNMQRLEEAQARNDDQISKLGDQMARLANQQAAGFEQLREAQLETNKTVQVLLKAQGRMDARLDSFMDQVERFIQESRESRGKV